MGASLLSSVDFHWIWVDFLHKGAFVLEDFTLHWNFLLSEETCIFLEGSPSIGAFCLPGEVWMGPNLDFLLKFAHRGFRNYFLK